MQQHLDKLRNSDLMRTLPRNFLLAAGAATTAILASHLLNEIFVKARCLLLPLLSTAPRPLGFSAESYNSSNKDDRDAMQRPIAIVTGGCGSIGSCLVKQLTKLGYNVEVWDVSVPSHDSGRRVVVNENSNQPQWICFHAVDVGDVASVQRACERFLGDNGRDGPDLLVLNAGIVARKGIGQFVAGEAAKVFQCNVSVHVLEILNQLLLPMVRARNDDGRDVPAAAADSSTVVPHPPWRRQIVLVSSVTGFAGSAFAAEYCASKAAVTVVGDSVRAEIRTRFSSSSEPFVPVDCLTVLPFIVRTPMFDFALHRAPWWLPPLEPDGVAAATLHGIREQRRVIVLPWLLHLMPLVRWGFPELGWRVGEWVLESNLWLAPEAWLKAREQE